jgi:hypothetical protein
MASVGAAGFEPATSWSQTRRDNRATLRPEFYLANPFLNWFCGESGIRTHGTVLPVRRFSKPFLSATQASLRPAPSPFFEGEAKVNINSFYSQIAFDFFIIK